MPDKLLKLWWVWLLGALAIALVLFLAKGPFAAIPTFLLRYEPHAANWQDWGESVVPTRDGGYALVGSTRSYGAGEFDLLVMKLDSKGNIHWQRTFGGEQEDFGSSVEQTKDGGYVVAGVRGLPAVAPDPPSPHFWVLKLDGLGQRQWDRIYGVNGEVLTCASDVYADLEVVVREVPAGGYVLAGQVTGAHSLMDAWILRLDAAGDVLWQFLYGEPGPTQEGAADVRPTSDGGFAVVGHVKKPDEWSDALVLRLDAAGGVLWCRTFGNALADVGRAVVEMAGGDLVVAGLTQSAESGTSGWVARLDPVGSLVWQEAYGVHGGTKSEQFSALALTKKNELGVAGTSWHPSGSGPQVWATLLAGTGAVQWSRRYGDPANPSFHWLASVETTVGGFALCGTVEPNVLGDILILRTREDGTLGTPSPCIVDLPLEESPPPIGPSPLDIPRQATSTLPGENPLKVTDTEFHPVPWCP